jgi:dTDP-4-dehydrorhamnose 3,5-epimerase-like enzyme
VVTFVEFDIGNDSRGWSFALDDQSCSALSAAKNIHFASIRPLAVRGNHFHVSRSEVIIVLPGAPWEVFWDTGEGTSINRRLFDGLKGVAVKFPPLWSHAIRNPGKADVFIAAISDHVYTARDPDTYRRNVSPV